ncbi:hypothetical protein WN55_06680 [Dufourea novaeangliae]|uniref:Transposase Tc1-like domain-containing protein n=1 Tax=Dufourea novaeangliae TaxID=178035 RepID=A0A154PQY2_DUFNO|nr:hypothetical protein WN55_06680 [Dufourea novaeangliae]
MEKSHVTLCNLEKRLREHSGLCKKSRNKPKPVPNENNTVNILAANTLNPQISQRKLAQTSHISRSSIQRILKQQKYHPYHLHTYSSRCLGGNILKPQKGDTRDFTITANQSHLEAPVNGNQSHEGDSHTEQDGDGIGPSVINDKSTTTEQLFKSPQRD